MLTVFQSAIRNPQSAIGADEGVRAPRESRRGRPRSRGFRIFNLKSQISNLKFFMVLALAATTIRAGAAETWFQPNKNAANNAFQNQPAAVIALSTGSQTWTSPEYSLADGAGTIVAGGTIYAVCQEGAFTWADPTDDKIYLAAIRAETGGRYWQSAPLVLGNSVAYGSNSGPTYDPAGGAVYIGTGDTVQKLNAVTGQVTAATRLTSVTTGIVAGAYDIINSSPAIGGNLLFIETYGGFGKVDKAIVALRKSDLGVVWAKKDGGIGNGTPCYVDNGTTQRVYTAGDLFVCCYNAADGALVWKSSTLTANPWTTAYDIAASLVYDGGNLYVTSEGFGGAGPGELICADAATGAKKWSAAIEWVSVPPVVMNGRVYVKGGYAHSVWCFDAATGAQMFKKVLGGGSYASFGNTLIAMTDRLYTTDGSRLMILDPATGNPLQALQDNYYGGALLLDNRGALYAHCGGRLAAFGTVVPVELSEFSVQ